MPCICRSHSRLGLISLPVLVASFSSGSTRLHQGIVDIIAFEPGTWTWPDSSDHALPLCRSCSALVLCPSARQFAAIIRSIPRMHLFSSPSSKAFLKYLLEHLNLLGNQRILLGFLLAQTEPLPQ